MNNWGRETQAQKASAANPCVVGMASLQECGGGRGLCDVGRSVCSRESRRVGNPGGQVAWCTFRKRIITSCG